MEPCHGGLGEQHFQNRRKAHHLADISHTKGECLAAVVWVECSHLAVSLAHQFERLEQQRCDLHREGRWLHTPPDLRKELIAIPLSQAFQ
ncbi:hypothetical protein D3C73_1429180 [compost metagenome]